MKAKNTCLVGQIALLMNQYDCNEINNTIILAIEDLNNYSEEDYPGDDQGFSFEWWLDSNFILNSGNFDIIDDNNINAFESPNSKELALFALFPDKAILHNENAEVALSKTQELVDNSTLTGAINGKADAFRHAYWNARHSRIWIRHH